MTDNSRNQGQNEPENRDNDITHNDGGPYNSGMGGTGSGMDTSSADRGSEGLGNQSQGISGTQGSTGSSGTQQGQGLEGGDSGRGSSMGTGSSKISDGDDGDGTYGNDEVSDTNTNSIGE